MKLRVFCLALSLWLLPEVILAVQVDTAWVRRYNGTGNYFDCAYDIVVDKQYNVYVTGISVGAGTGNDYLTIKYNSQGDTIWTRRYHSGYWNGVDDAFAMAIDSSGNIIVTGMSAGPDSSYDYLTIKYNSNGNLLWAQRYNGEVGGKDEALAITADDSGNVYVTGWSVGPTGDTSHSYGFYDYLTIKYTPAGDTVWVRRYNGTGNYLDRAEDIGVDSEGNVYVTGMSGGNTTAQDYTTIKYNPIGETLWVRRYDGPTSENDVAHAIAIDRNNNIYIAGESVGNTGDLDYATVKYNSDGQMIWAQRYDGPVSSYDVASCIVIDDMNNVYVTGESFDTAAPVYATIKYNPLGDTLWLRKCEVSGASVQTPHDIAVDKMGNVYVTGESGGAVADKYFTVAYNSLGNELWVQEYGVISNGYNCPLAITVDDSSNVYVTGTSEGFSHYDYATIKYIQKTGVEEKCRIETCDRFSLLKNPANRVIELDLAFVAGKNITIRLYDISGRLTSILFDGKAPERLDIPTQGFSSGIYFLKLKDEKEEVFKKIAIIK